MTSRFLACRVSHCLSCMFNRSPSLFERSDMNLSKLPSRVPPFVGHMGYRPCYVTFYLFSYDQQPTVTAVCKVTLMETLPSLFQTTGAQSAFGRSSLTFRSIDIRLRVTPKPLTVSEKPGFTLRNKEHKGAFVSDVPCVPASSVLILGLIKSVVEGVRSDCPTNPNRKSCRCPSCPPSRVCTL